MRYSGANIIYIRLRAYTRFCSWSRYYTTLFKAVGVVATHGHSSNLAAISITAGSVMDLPCTDAIYRTTQLDADRTAIAC